MDVGARGDVDNNEASIRRNENAWVKSNEAGMILMMITKAVLAMAKEMSFSISVIPKCD